MPDQLLVDAVTMRHFGVVHRMDVLAARLAGYPPPRWATAVQSEILDHIDEDDCKTVLEADFLGNSYSLPDGALSDVFHLQIALGGRSGTTEQLGEAETLWVADHLNGTVVTDDFAAYDLAEKNFGSNRVLDTVELLREAVRADELEPSQAQQIADGIRNSGRYLRAGHPPTFTADYFDRPML